MCARFYIYMSHLSNSLSSLLSIRATSRSSIVGFADVMSGNMAHIVIIIRRNIILQREDASKRLMYIYFKLSVSSFSLLASLFHCIGRGKNHTHAAMPFDFRFSEYPHLHTRFFKHFFKIADLNAA